MHVLLDECVPREMRSELLDHAVKTVVEMVWAGTRNGTLLRRAISEFEVLLTVDQGVPYQQNIEGLAVALIIIKAPSNDINATGSSRDSTPNIFSTPCKENNRPTTMRVIE